jgi:3-oxoacyl-[acyl-carrier-protein] synthase II
MRDRAVITGVGVVTPALSGDSAALGVALAGLAGPGAPRQADGDGALMPDALIDRLTDESERRRLSRICQLAVAAARLALTDAGLPSPDALGLVIGSELGDLRSTRAFAEGFLQRGPVGLSPLLFPCTVMNTMAATTAIAVNAREMSLTLTVPAVAGELAVARATAAVVSGRVPRALAGGVDDGDPFVEEVLSALAATGEARSEGAAAVLVESLAAATARGARVLGEIRGVAWGTLPAPRYGIGRRAASRAIVEAAGAAGLALEDLGWIYTSASGDRARDAWETRVLASALAPRQLPATALGRRLGQHAGLGVLRVAAAAWTARSGLLAMAAPASGVEVAAATGPSRVRPGAGLVHGLGRGGTQVALVVGPPP